MQVTIELDNMLYERAIEKKNIVLRLAFSYTPRRGSSRKKAKEGYYSNPIEINNINRKGKSRGKGKGQLYKSRQPS